MHCHSGESQSLGPGRRPGSRGSRGAGGRGSESVLPWERHQGDKRVAVAGRAELESRGRSPRPRGAGKGLSGAGGPSRATCVFSSAAGHVGTTVRGRASPGSLGPWACRLRLRGRLGRGRGSPHPRLRPRNLASPVSRPRRSRTVLFEETRATENRQSPRRALGPQPWGLGSEPPRHDGLFTPARAADILVSRASFAGVSSLEGQAQGPWALSPRWAELHVGVPQAQAVQVGAVRPPWDVGPGLCHPLAVLLGGWPAGLRASLARARARRGC